MEFKRFNISEVSAERYYQLPKFLFEGEFKRALSAEAKVLYALLRDRFNLSCKNGWANDKGEVYLIYTREEMCDMIGCAMQKIRRLINELKEAGLFEEEQVGQNMPNRIFLTYIDISSGELPAAENGNGADENFITENEEKSSQKPLSYADCRKSTLQENKPFNHADFSEILENHQEEKSGLLKINTPDCRKSTPNKTDNNNYNIFNINPSFIQNGKDEIELYNMPCEQRKNSKGYEKILNETKEQIEYDILKQIHGLSPFNADIVDSIVEIMADIRTSEEPYISVGGKNIATEKFCFKLGKLTSEDIDQMINRFKEQPAPTNARAYLTAMLYNAGIETYFSSF